MSLKGILEGIFHYEYNRPFWYIFTLFFFILLSPLIDKLLHNKITGVISIAVVTILCYYDIGLPVPLFFSKTPAITYLLGAFIGRFAFDWFEKPLPKWG